MHQPFPTVRYHYPTEKKASAALAIIDPTTGIDIRSALVERKSSNVSESEKPEDAPSPSTRGSTPGAASAAAAAAAAVTAAAAVSPAVPASPVQTSNVKSELAQKIAEAISGEKPASSAETAPVQIAASTPVARTLSVTTTTTTTATASSPVKTHVSLSPSVVPSAPNTVETTTAAPPVAPADPVDVVARDLQELKIDLKPEAEPVPKVEEKKDEPKVEKVLPQPPPPLMDLAPPASVGEIAVPAAVAKPEVAVAATALPSSPLVEKTEVPADGKTAAAAASTVAAAAEKPLSKSQQKKMKTQAQAQKLAQKSELDAFLPPEELEPVVKKDEIVAEKVGVEIKAESEVKKIEVESKPEAVAVKSPTPLMPPIDKEVLAAPAHVIPALMKEPSPIAEPAKEKSPEVAPITLEPEAEKTVAVETAVETATVAATVAAADGAPTPKELSPIAAPLPSSSSPATTLSYESVVPDHPKDIEDEILDNNENKIEDSGYGETEEPENTPTTAKPSEPTTTATTTTVEPTTTADTASVAVAAAAEPVATAPPVPLPTIMPTTPKVSEVVESTRSDAERLTQALGQQANGPEPDLELEDGEIPPDEDALSNISSRELTPVSSKDTSLEPESREQTPTSNQSSPQPINYDSDQWSPANPAGKKVYDRAFLLNLQFNAISMKKPDTLPSITDVILDKPRPPSAPSNNPTPQGPAMIPSAHMHMDPFNPTWKAVGPGPMGVPMGGPMGGFARPIMQGPGGSFRGDDRRRGPDPRMMGPGAHQQQMGGGRNNSMKGQTKVISIGRSIGGDVKLNQSENAWKPANKEKPTDAETAKTEKLYKSVRGILNKLTPQKFSVLVKQVLDLDIDSEDRLKGCINIIFEKAIDEPGFSVAYANMCKHLMLIKVQLKDGKSDKDEKPKGDLYFRKILLNRCQKEFEAGALLETDFEQEFKQIQEIKDEKEREEAEENHNIKTAKAKRRYLGNIRFIGELFKLKMLTEPIMHDCICKLLSKKEAKQPDKHDEESLECLCRLLSTIGKDLDHDKSKAKIDSYFREMEKIVKNKKTATSRVRFMLMDVVELRKCNWVPRRDDNAPKTIDQIHKQAEREEQEMLAKLAESKQKERDNKSHPRNVRGNTPAGGRPGGEDGWQTVPTVKSMKIDPTKLKISKPAVSNDDDIQLGPGGRPGGWNRGSLGGSSKTAETPASAAPADRPSSGPGNRFGLLSGSDAGNNPAPNRPYDNRGGPPGLQPGGRFTPSRDSSPWQAGAGSGGPMGGPRGGPAGIPPAPMGKRPPTGGPRDFRDEGRRDPFNPFDRRPNSRPSSRPGSQPGSREGSRSRDQVHNLVAGERSRGSSPYGGSSSSTPPPQRGSTEAAKPSPPTKPALTDSQIEKKVQGLMDEYIGCKDEKEAVACVEELKCAEKMPFVVETILMQVIEASSSARILAGQLFSRLVKEGLLTPEQFVEGSSSLWENVEDFLIDIPSLWNYLGEIFGGLITSNGHFPLKHFAKFCDSLKAGKPGKPGKFLAAVLKRAEESLGKQTLATCWQSAGLSFDDLLGEGGADAFLDSNNLRFLVASSSDAAADASAVNSANIPTTTPSSSSPRAPLDLNQFSKELEKRLRNGKEVVETQNWIHEKVGDDMVKDPTFVRALMTATAAVAVSGESTMAVYKNEELKRHSKLLQHFFNEDVTLETQAVYALQSFVHSLQHPPNVLQQIFDTCYDEDVISEAAFRAWYDATDREEDGKGVAKLSVVNFFKWLDEADDEADDENAK